MAGSSHSYIDVKNWRKVVSAVLHLRVRESISSWYDLTVLLHSDANALTLIGEASDSAVFTARFKFLVDSPRSLRALREDSLAVRREVAVVDSWGWREGRERECHWVWAVWIGRRSGDMMDALLEDMVYGLCMRCVGGSAQLYWHRK